MCRKLTIATTDDIYVSTNLKYIYGAYCKGLPLKGYLKHHHSPEMPNNKLYKLKLVFDLMHIACILNL